MTNKKQPSAINFIVFGVFSYLCSVVFSVIPVLSVFFFVCGVIFMLAAAAQVWTNIIKPKSPLDKS